MHTLDWVVLVGYFVVLAGIGYWSMLRVKKQEDFFMGGRSFGKILQSFAAFGAGTGSNDPVVLGRSVFTSGLSGIWSVLLWLFATPFYWIFAVWYRRMRHLTLGDWFVERYESRGMGAAYTLFAIGFYMAYLAVAFTAVGKVCKPLIGFSEVHLRFIEAPLPVEYVLVPVIALVVILYGVMGGLRAAYWTDLLQGVFIILLSVMLIPAGLNLLAKEKGADAAGGVMEGFRVMHEQIPAYNFEIIGGVRSSEFPIYYIAAIVLINLVGIVVQPHFIATGGGSAKTENSARVGLVAGNFMKRFCTVGWALTALIVLALFADSPDINADPDQAWGIASQAILGPFNLGLVGLMLACLLAALMSSADCYMLVASALVVRNLYVAYVNPKASEKACIAAGRITSMVIIVGGTVISLASLKVFDLLKVTWEMPILFAAPFWIGMFWRRASGWAAWLTILFSLGVFFLVPALGPKVWTDLPAKPQFHTANEIVQTVIERKATPSDVAKREAQIENWEKDRDKLLREQFNKNAQGGDGQTTFAPPTAAEQQQALAEVERKLGPRPQPLTAGEVFLDKSLGRRGGKAIFWTGGLEKVDDAGEPLLDKDGQPVKFTDDDYEQIGQPKETERDGVKIIETRYRYKEGLKVRGAGNFNLDFLLYQWSGLNLATYEDALLETLRLPPRVITPFLVMVLLSLITPRNKERTLDRYYAKMKTPVDPDPEIDAQNVDAAAGHPEQLEHRKLLPGTSFEFQKPTLLDITGFVVSFIACFLIIWMAVWLAQLGS